MRNTILSFFLLLFGVILNAKEYYITENVALIPDNLPTANSSAITNDLYESGKPGKVMLFEKNALTSFPVKYDLRTFNLTSAVRNQSPGGGIAPAGNCWCFANMACLENRMIKAGMSLTQLSVQNMATCHGFESGFGEGGTDKMAMAFFTRLAGPYSELKYPYSLDVKNTKCIKPTGKPLFYIPEARVTNNSPNLVKLAISNFGGATSNIYIGESASEFYTYYDDKSKSAMYSGAKGPTHEVMLVGWDDNKIIRGVKGAWIAKNSWGESFAENGYFYLSYRMANVVSLSSYYPTIWQVTDIDSIIYRDTLGATANFGYHTNIGYALSKFSIGNDHILSHVGTYIAEKGSIVDIEIFSKKSGDTLSNSITKREGIKCANKGFYVFDIPANISGDFYVKVKYFTPGTKRYPIPIEAKIKYAGINTTEVYAAPHISAPGDQWISKDGVIWDAIGNSVANYKADLSIKAYFKKNTKGMTPSFSIQSEILCKGSEQVVENLSIGNISSYSWNFGEGANPIVSTLANPPKIIYNSGGLKTISLEVTNNTGEKSIYSKQFVVTDFLLANASISQDKIKPGDTILLTTSTFAKQYQWKASKGKFLDDATQSECRFTSNDTGTFYISLDIVDGSCVNSDSSKIIVKHAPVNDLMCNAIELTLGNHGPFTNVNAGVEFGEPQPVSDTCKGPLKWCPVYSYSTTPDFAEKITLDNSVWFRLTAPSSGKITIRTDSLDTQIALYKADNCSQITLSNLKFANDDYYDTPPYPAILNNISVTPNATYYLQVDGSNGGVSGNFYISISETPLNIDEFETGYKTELIPNPNNGNFSIRFPDAINGKVKMMITDLTGKNILEFNSYIENQMIQIDEYIPKGLYLILIKPENLLPTKMKLVIN